MNNNKLLICVIIGIIVLFANGTPYSPSQVPQQMYSSQNCSLGYGVSGGGFSCFLCKKGFGLAYDGIQKVWICLSNTQYKVDKCAQWECEPTSQCNCKCIKCACGYGLFVNDTATQCWNNEFFVRQCEYYNSDGSCRQCKYNYDTNLYQNSQTGIADTQKNGTNSYVNQGWLSLDYGLLPNGNCINNRDMDANNFSIPHCSIYSFDNTNNEYYCSQCHQTYRMYLNYDNSNINYFFKYTYVAYYAPHNGNTNYKACLKVPYQYDDAFSKDRNNRLDFTQYSNQDINTGYADTIYCDESKSLTGNFDQYGNPILSNDGICFINSSRTTNVNSNTCYYVYNKSPSNPSAIYSAHIGCYIAPGLLDSNSKRLCTTWSNYIDNLTAVCRTCKAYDNSNPVILPDVSGLNCINVDSYYLNSLRQNCYVLENGSTSTAPSCAICKSSVTGGFIAGVTGTQTCATTVANCRTYWQSASDLTNFIFLGNCYECHWGFTSQVYYSTTSGDTKNQTSSCVWNNWQDPGTKSPSFTKGIPGCIIFNLSSDGTVQQGLCMYNNGYKCKLGFQSGPQSSTDLTKVCTCPTATLNSINLDVCPLNSTSNCTQYYDQRFCSQCLSSLVMTSDDQQCGNYTALTTNITCASNTTKGICQYCDPGSLLKKSQIGKNFYCYTKPSTLTGSTNNPADNNCLNMDDTGTNTNCEYNTLTQGLASSTTPQASQNYDEKCLTPLKNTFGNCLTCNSDSQVPTSTLKAYWFQHFPYCIPKNCDYPWMHPTMCLQATFNSKAMFALDIFSSVTGGQIVDHTQIFSVKNVTSTDYCSNNTLTAQSTDASIAVDWNQDQASITKKCVDNTVANVTNCLITDFYAGSDNNRNCLACKTGYKLDTNNVGKCIAIQQSDVDTWFPNCLKDNFNTLSVLYSIDKNGATAYSFSFCSTCGKGFIPSVVGFDTLDGFQASSATKTSDGVNTINECVALNTQNFVVPDPACRVAYKSSPSSTSQKYSCWKCELSRYLANDGSCHPLPYNCLILDSVNSKVGVPKCSLCKYGYKLNTNPTTQFTYCAYDSIKHCSVYTDMSGTACSTCDSGYWLYNSTTCITNLCAVPSNYSLDYCYLCKDMVTYFVNITKDYPDQSSGICSLRKQGYEQVGDYSYNYFSSPGAYANYFLGQNCDPTTYSTTIRTSPDCKVCYNQNIMNMTCNRDQTQYYLLANRTFNLSTVGVRYYSLCVQVYNVLAKNCYAIQNNSNYINADNCIQCQPGFFLYSAQANNDTNKNLTINYCIPVDLNCIQSDATSFNSTCSKCRTGLPNNDCIYPDQYANYISAYYVNSTNSSQCIQITNCIMSDGYNNSCGFCQYPTYGLLSDLGVCVNNGGGSTIPQNRTINQTANCRRYSLANNSTYICDTCHDTYFKVFDTRNANYYLVNCYPKKNCLQIASGVTIPNITSSTQTVDSTTYLSKLSCGSCVKYSYRYSDSSNNYVLTCSDVIVTPAANSNNNYFGCAFKESQTYFTGTLQNPVQTKADTCTSCQSNQCQNFVLVQDYSISDVDTYNRIFPTYCMNNDHECGIDSCRIIRSQQYAGSANSNYFYYNFERLLCGQCFYGFDLNAGSADCDSYNTTNDGSTAGLVYPISGQDGTGQDGGYIPPVEGTDGKDGKDGKEGPGPKPVFSFPSVHLNYGLELICLFIFGVLAIIYG